MASDFHEKSSFQISLVDREDCIYLNCRKVQNQGNENQEYQQLECKKSTILPLNYAEFKKYCRGENIRAFDHDSRMFDHSKKNRLEYNLHFTGSIHM